MASQLVSSYTILAPAQAETYNKKAVFGLNNEVERDIPVLKDVHAIESLPVQQESETGKQTRYIDYKMAEFEVGPSGGIFKMPTLGVEMLIPPNAVSEDVSMKISIMEEMPVLSKDRCMAMISPRVRIEPHNLNFKLPILLSINHNLVKFEKRSSPMILHRDNDEAPWEVVPHSSETTSDTLGFPVCQTKQAVLTSTKVLVSMQTNCEFMVVLDAHNNEHRVRRMDLVVYADYQPNGRHLNVRVYAVHATADRQQDIRESERHYIGTSHLYIDNSYNPVRIDLNVSSTSAHLSSQSGVIGYNDINTELAQRRGNIPIKSFCVDLTSLPLGQESVLIEVRANQCAFALAHPGSVMCLKDLTELRPITQPDLVPPMRARRPLGPAHNNGPGESQTAPVQISEGAVQRDNIVQFLQDILQDDEKDRIMRETGEENPQDAIETFVDDKSIPDIIAELYSLFNDLREGIGEGLDLLRST